MIRLTVDELQAISHATTAMRSGLKKSSLRVDLVVLLTCFATLAVVALPRHLSIAEQARRQEVATLARGIDSAADLGYTLWEAAGRPDAFNTGRGRLRMVHGYPDTASLAVLLERPETMAFEFRGDHWQHRDASGAAGCRVYYRPPGQRGDYPRITVDDAGC